MALYLYELVTKLSHHKCKSGYIWCTDGTFISPLRFKKLNRTAYGYALGDNKVVSIKRSTVLYKWAGSSNSPFYQRIRSAESTTDGISNSDILKSIPGYSSSNCPAIYVCLNMSNANKQSYMPAVDELRNLYDSIMSGRMKEDLIEAGLYEMCNYGLDNPSSWGWIWSSSQFPSDSNYYFARYVGYDGGQGTFKDYTTGYVIPFFKFHDHDII